MLCNGEDAKKCMDYGTKPKKMHMEKKYSKLPNKIKIYSLKTVKYRFKYYSCIYVINEMVQSKLYLQIGKSINFICYKI